MNNYYIECIAPNEYHIIDLSNNCILGIYDSLNIALDAINLFKQYFQG